MRPRDSFRLLILSGLENLTRALFKGDPFDEQSRVDLEHLRNRCAAFVAAFDQRIRLIDDEDEKE